jgi:hypothetical protein
MSGPRSLGARLFRLRRQPTLLLLLLLLVVVAAAASEAAPCRAEEVRAGDLLLACSHAALPPPDEDPVEASQLTSPFIALLCSSCRRRPEGCHCLLALLMSGNGCILANKFTAPSSSTYTAAMSFEGQGLGICCTMA